MRVTELLSQDSTFTLLVHTHACHRAPVTRQHIYTSGPHSCMSQSSCHKTAHLHFWSTLMRVSELLSQDSTFTLLVHTHACHRAPVTRQHIYTSGPHSCMSQSSCHKTAHLHFWSTLMRVSELLSQDSTFTLLVHTHACHRAPVTRQHIYTSGPHSCMSQSSCHKTAHLHFWSTLMRVSELLSQDSTFTLLVHTHACHRAPVTRRHIYTHACHRAPVTRRHIYTAPFHHSTAPCNHLFTSFDHLHITPQFTHTHSTIILYCVIPIFIYHSNIYTTPFHHSTIPPFHSTLPPFIYIISPFTHHSTIYTHPFNHYFILHRSFICISVQHLHYTISPYILYHYTISTTLPIHHLCGTIPQLTLHHYTYIQHHSNIYHLIPQFILHKLFYLY